MKTTFKTITEIINDEREMDKQIAELQANQRSQGINSLSEQIDKLHQDPGHCPLPIEIIPNHMGINLSAIDGISWQRQDDGQLTQVTIYFNPEQK